MQTVIEKIQEILPNLKSAELRVANYTLENINKISELTISELAERAQTSEPTVIRLCRKIGLKGYTDLRLNLARNLVTTDTVTETVKKDDNSVNILHKIFQANIDAFNSTLPAVDARLLEEAVELLASTKRLCFYAFGGSGNVVRDSHHKFFRLGIPCQVYTDAHMQFMSASLLDENSVVVACSLNGSTRDLVEAVSIAKRAGAKVIGLIGRKKSPLGKACDLVLAIEVDEVARDIFPMATRITQLALLDTLYVAVINKKWPDVKDCLDKVKDTLALRNY